MADVTPQKRALPARERRESAAKRRAMSPAQPPSTTSTPTAHKPSTPGSTPATGRKTGYTRGPYKKRASLVQGQTPTLGSRSSPSVSISGDVLPARVMANKPLATTKERPPSKLSLKEYQSIAESAILAASLYQSRIQWLYNGIFQKYYVKKRKGVEVPPNNPDVKSMQRLGSATITVEPHTFDAMFYVVRDATVPQPYQRHPNQHTTKQMGPPAHPTPNAGYPSQPPHQQPHIPPTVSNRPSTTMPPAPPQSAPAQAPPPAKATENGAPEGPAKHENNGQPTSAGLPAAPIPNEPQTRSPQPGPKPNPTAPTKGSTQDPVIQMLAARAASDSQLKELMKIVATSRASPEQLKEFQSHIDEFNEVIRRQEAARIAKKEGPANQPSSTRPGLEASQPSLAIQSKPATPSPPAPASTPTPAPAAATMSLTQPAVQSAPQMQPRQQSAPAATPPGPPSAPAALPGVVHTFPNPPAPVGRGGPMTGYVGYPTPARPEPFIKHIVLELTSVPAGGQAACPDRWLFPEHAVLEIRPNGLDMICSFLVERKASQIVSRAGAELPAGKGEAEGKAQGDQEYYQPVTMTIKARDHKIIQTIAKAAKTLPAVQDYMKEVMGKKVRAPVEYLVHQLPRERSHVGTEGTDTGFVDSGVELSSDAASDDDELKDWYGI
ncbi:hypothetical protein PV04_00040 [Phialophora macrospora]|uniref:SWR1-complex protein 3 domain-containing protein n=1 Tax=Phialophora macrospora TaxID=1851006 RepID=A0A0D2EBZ5_9EURO|nr:hypothetical protein PV04_00040 [Phialophora macrospora]